MVCPLCKHNSLIEQSIVQYKDNGGVRIVGREVFCLCRDWIYQENIPGRLK